MIISKSLFLTLAGFLSGSFCFFYSEVSEVGISIFLSVASLCSCHFIIFYDYITKHNRSKKKKKTSNNKKFPVKA